MKKFIVLKKVGKFSADEVRSFATKESAQQFINLMRETEENEYTKYYLCELIDY
jgi:nicotinamide riboside kinase